MSLADDLDEAIRDFNAAEMSMSSIEQFLGRVEKVSEKMRRLGLVLTDWASVHTKKHPYANVWDSTKIATHGDCKRWAQLIGLPISEFRPCLPENETRTARGEAKARAEK